MVQHHPVMALTSSASNNDAEYKLKIRLIDEILENDCMITVYIMQLNPNSIRLCVYFQIVYLAPWLHKKIKECMHSDPIFLLWEESHHFV